MAAQGNVLPALSPEFPCRHLGLCWLSHPSFTAIGWLVRLADGTGASPTRCGAFRAWAATWQITAWAQGRVGAQLRETEIWAEVGSATWCQCSNEPKKGRHDCAARSCAVPRTHARYRQLQPHHRARVGLQQCWQGPGGSRARHCIAGGQGGLVPAPGQATAIPRHACSAGHPRLRACCPWSRVNDCTVPVPVPHAG